MKSFWLLKCSHMLDVVVPWISWMLPISFRVFCASPWAIFRWTLFITRIMDGAGVSGTPALIDSKVEKDWSEIKRYLEFNIMITRNGWPSSQAPWSISLEDRTVMQNRGKIQVSSNSIFSIKQTTNPCSKDVTTHLEQQIFTDTNILITLRTSISVEFGCRHPNWFLVHNSQEHIKQAGLLN